MRSLGLVCGTALVLCGCGPIDYLNTVTRKATQAVAEARTANAERLAPYEFWSAVEYLQMAREKAAYADYQVAINYGEKSEKMGLDAVRLAKERATRQGPLTPGRKDADENPPEPQKEKP